MSSIATNKNKTTLYYHSGTTLGKQTLPYIEAASNSVQSIDVSETKITGTQWLTLADALNLGLSDLINKEHPNFLKHYSSATNLSQEDWIKVLNANPETLKCPILIVGAQYFLIETPSKVTALLNVEGEDLDEQNPN